MKLALIAARARNGVIGKGNTLPWHLPEDLRHFKALTMGKPMIMGRKTFDSIGRPLPGRTTLVVTRQQDWRFEGVEVCHSLQEALTRAEALLPESGSEVMVVGGEQLYRQSLPLADTIYLTEVAVDVEGDAFFPAIADDHWLRTVMGAGISQSSGIAYEFTRLEKLH